MKRLVEKSSFDISELEKKEILYVFFSDLENFADNLGEQDFDFLYKVTCLNDGNEVAPSSIVVDYYLQQFNFSDFKQLLINECDDVNVDDSDEDYITQTIKNYHKYTDRKPYSWIAGELEDKYEMFD